MVVYTHVISLSAAQDQEKELFPGPSDCSPDFCKHHPREPSPPLSSVPAADNGPQCPTSTSQQVQSQQEEQELHSGRKKTWSTVHQCYLYIPIGWKKRAERCTGEPGQPQSLAQHPLAGNGHDRPISTPQQESQQNDPQRQSTEARPRSRSRSPHGVKEEGKETHGGLDTHFSKVVARDLKASFPSVLLPNRQPIPPPQTADHAEGNRPHCPSSTPQQQQALAPTSNPEETAIPPSKKQRPDEDVRELLPDLTIPQTTNSLLNMLVDDIEDLYIYM